MESERMAGFGSRLVRRGRIARRALGALALALLALTLVPSDAANAQPGLWDEPPITVTAVPEKETVRPGDQVAVAVVIEHDEGFHTWPNEPVIPPEFGGDFPAIATEVSVLSAPPDVSVWPVQYPEPEPVEVFYTGAPVDLLSYAGTAVAYLPLQLPPDQPTGAAQLELQVSYQTCDETTCYFPQDLTLPVSLDVKPAGEGAAAPTDPALFGGFARDVFSTPPAEGGAAGAAAAVCEAVTFNVFGWSGSVSPCGPLGIGLLLLAAALGGLLLNFTPCVLPVIPLKIMGLRQAAENPARLFGLGLAMSLGVVAFWMVIGGAIAFIAGFDAISSLFQTGWFSLVVGAFVAVMALGMFDVFTVQLPQSVYKVNPGHDTLHGSALFGVLTAILSTPCTAPFMGGASAWAATQDPSITLATFGAIGAGMALPYLVLTARPQLINRLPRSGPGSVLIKRVMGLAMLAVAAFFLGIPLAAWLQTPPDPASRAYWWVVALFVLLAVGWLVYRTVQLTSDTRRRLAVAVPALVVAIGTVVLVQDLASEGPIDWVYYTPERFAAAQAEGHVVVMDFTAEWCLNCKALETGVLHTAEIVELLEQDGVVPMRVDLTGDNPVGRAKLRELEWVGLPLLAVFGPGTGYDDPLKYDAYTRQMVKDSVRQAAGGPQARSGG